ncbi:MAG TPA: threonine synthase [Terriglobia bacterium]|nr:threonine synthase [Terriglobia bacterium]
MSLLVCLECSRCQKQFEPGKVYNLCSCGAPLLARYQLRKLAGRRIRSRLASRPATLWRYREVLPIKNEDSIVSLGEGFTPLLHARRLGEQLGIPHLYLKDESQNPTGSFKARGMALAVSMAHELGITKVAVPSAGNAAGALAAYGAKAGMQTAVFMPVGTPLANRLECEAHGAKVVLVPGSIKDCARVMRESSGDEGWFDVSTLREPYRLEGKKTMAYEVFEQLDWRLPDAMIYPTGGGTGLIGMWKAFDEMQEMGWINSRRPRMISVQASGCAPMVRAFEAGAEQAEEWKNPTTAASGLRVPSAIGDFLILKAIRETQGCAVAVDDAAMLDAVSELARTEGVFTSPEGGATLVALKHLLADGRLKGQERIVLFLTATAYKYMEALESLVSDQKS